MALDKKSIALLYGKRAGMYDISANLYYLLGFREFAYRKMAIKALDLKRGDTVIELGCGTGLNFDSLIKQVGSQGRIIGVDMTPEMLLKAEKRCKNNGWTNISLVHSDISTYPFPEHFDGIISTFALT